MPGPQKLISENCWSRFLQAKRQPTTSNRVQNNPGFLKSPTHWVFGGFIGFLGFMCFFGFLYLNKLLGTLLVDLAQQLSFYLDSSVVQITKNLQIHYLLFIRRCKHKEVFNYYWHDKLKLNYVWCRFSLFFFQRALPKKLHRVLPGCLNPGITIEKGN